MSQTADISRGSRRGFTLVELIVAMAIFTIIMGGVMVMFTTVTSSVRRGYRTMDLFDATHGALLTVERDIQSAFSAPATGADFHFYGEPNGFVFVGIAPDGKLGRLTYAVHVDTSRLTSPLADWRGETMTLSVERADMVARYGTDFTTLYYPGTDAYLDVEVEVVYGLLLRYYEEDVNEVTRFEKLDTFEGIDGKTFVSRIQPPHLPFPSLLKGATFEASTYRTKGIPWIFNDYPNNLNFWTPLDVSVPWHIKEKISVVEKCHYWMQMLNGPRIMPSGTGYFPWTDNPTLNNPFAIWAVSDVFDQFWYDHIPFKNLSVAGVASLGLPAGFESFVPVPGSSTDTYGRSFLWDHVVARDFALFAWLINPDTGRPVSYDINVVDIDPVFQYAVESGLAQENNKVKNFNTLFNLNFTDNVDDDADLGGMNAVDALLDTLVNNPSDTALMGKAVEEMTTSHQFYDLGDPIQSRLPSAFDINLFVISPPVTTSAPPDVFKFSQTIHIPSGFLRRSLSVD